MPAAEAQNNASLRLRPDMGSRRLLVMAFVREYIGRWGQSPSYGEIANSLAISHTRAKQLVKVLVSEGQLLRRPGRRGLSLPTVRDEAIRLLREQGYSVDEDILSIRSPLPNSTLRRSIRIDYVNGRTVERDAGRSGGTSRDEPGCEAAGTTRSAEDPDGS